MAGKFRPRRLVQISLLGALALGLAACNGVYPNTTFSHNSEYNTAIDALWDKLLLLGTIVFIGVQVALLYVIVKFRRRPDSPQPKPVHGSTTLEITWTVLPALVLILVAIPTVKTIFRTQANAAPEALLVEVIGHQWWWEFRYPQYNFSTANELYLPVGRTVSFQLKTVDVLHSFWIPAMGGKRDLITNRTNYMWFTPNDTLPSSAWNGACAEFCGESHANMKFRVYTVKQPEFELWIKNQQATVALTNAPPPQIPAALPAGGRPPGTTPAAGTGTGVLRGGAVQGEVTPPRPTAVATASMAGGATPLAMPAPERAAVWMFPAEKITSEFGYTIPKTPIPDGNDFNDALLAGGDARRGAAAAIPCMACHSFVPKPPEGMPIIAPNLTHFGSRHTLGAGLYPNDSRHLARWIKNSPKMKPGSLMQVMGKGQINPKTGKPDVMSNLTDQQIADIVAYLQALK